jgi:hypothetical protein
MRFGQIGNIVRDPEYEQEIAEYNIAVKEARKVARETYWQRQSEIENEFIAEREKVAAEKLA